MWKDFCFLNSMVQRKWEWNADLFTSSFIFSLASHEIILLTSYEIESDTDEDHDELSNPPFRFCETVLCVCVLVSFCGYVGYDTFAWLDFLMKVFLFSNIHKLLQYLSRAVINSRWYLLLFSIDFFTIWCIVMELIKQKVGYSCWSFGLVFGNNTSRENSNGPHAFYKEILVFFFWYGSNCLWWLWISVGALSSDSIVTCFVLLSEFISLCWWEIGFFDFKLKLV